MAWKYDVIEGCYCHTCDTCLLSLRDKGAYWLVIATDINWHRREIKLDASLLPAEAQTRAMAWVESWEIKTK